MTTLDRPPCTAQHTDDLNTWGCVGRHFGDYHVAEVDGVITRLWRDLDATADPDQYRDLIGAVEALVAAVRGRATDPRVRAVVAAYDALTNPGAVAS